MSVTIVSIVLIVIIIMLLFWIGILSNQKKTAAELNAELASSSQTTSSSAQQESFYNEIPDMANMRAPMDREWNTGTSLWDEVYGNTYTIVGGNSVDAFRIGQKFKISRGGNMFLDNLGGLDGSYNRLYDEIDVQRSRPFIYVETSSNGLDWMVHPDYSLFADGIDFEGESSVVMQTNGGNIRIVKYPDGTIWVQNDSRIGSLSGIKLKKCDVVNDFDDDYEPGDESSSALRSAVDIADNDAKTNTKTKTGKKSGDELNTTLKSIPDSRDKSV